MVFSVLQRKLGIHIELANTLLVEQQVPKYIPLIIRLSFRLGLHRLENATKVEDTKKSCLKVPFHNKGIEMIKLSQILQSKSIKRVIPTFIQNQTPPTISYSYTKTIAGKIFNFKQSIKDIDFELGTTNLSCDCHVSDFRYEPVG